jgi:hypothetical protein
MDKPDDRDAPATAPDDPVTSSAERRRAPRLDKVFPVIVSGPRGITFGIARNVSEGGMFLEAVESQPLGARVSVTFAFPGSAAEITAEAEVRYTSTLNYRGRRTGLPASTRGMGLKFVRFLEQEHFGMGEGGGKPADPSLLH